MRPKLHNSFKTCLRAACCFLLLGSVSSQVYGTSGTWTQTGSGFWDVGANWTSNPVFPNGQSDVAAFIGSLVGNPVINSNTDITIGALHINSPEPPVNTLTIGFTNNKLIFDASFNVSKIFSGKLGTVNINTPIQLNSQLEIYNDSNLTFSKPITGTGGKATVAISSSAFGSVIYTASNTYVGETFVNNRTLVLSNLAGNCINGPVTVYPNGILFTARNNQFADTVDLTTSGVINISSPTTQKCRSVTTFGSSGSMFGNNSTVTFLNAGPNPAIRMGGESRFFVQNVVLQNQGSIVYDFNLSLGQASFGSSNVLSTVNLGGGNVQIGLHTGTNAYFDVILRQINFTNGTLNIQTLSGPEKGVVCIAGTLPSTIPATVISNAKLLIGFANNTHIVDVFPLGSTIDIQAGGILGGVASLGVAGSANVLNSAGILQPGFAAGSNSLAQYGQLRISGNYTQNAAGTLEIKLATPVIFDKLVVETGNVVLDGKLSLISDSNRVLAAGDQFVIIDNTTGANPITGQFSSIEAFLPPDLVADIQYLPQTVVVTLNARCPKK
jgi:hypothetical protein